MKAIVIIPTYNEKENIGKLIQYLEEEVFPPIKNHTMGILIADDFSPDDTAGVVRELMKKYKNLDINQGKKAGLGAAYVRSMTYAIDSMGADVVMEMDADGQHDATKIPEFLQKIEEGNDFVIGTRYSGGGSIPARWGIDRKFLSVFGNLFIRLVLMRPAIHDWTGGFRMITKEVFQKEKMKLRAFTGYNFQVGSLLSAVQDGFKVAEVPFNFGERTLGDSKIKSGETIVKTLTFVIVERIKELQRFIKFLVVGGTGFIVQLIFQESSVRALHVGHPVGVVVGAEAAIISNFLFNNFWTFSDTRNITQGDNFIVRLVKFNVTSLGAIAIQYLADYFAELVFGPTMHLFGLSAPTRIIILFPTIICIVIPMNYIIYNVFIWKTKYLKDEATTKA